MAQLLAAFSQCHLPRNASNTTFRTGLSTSQKWVLPIGSATEAEFLALSLLTFPHFKTMHIATAVTPGPPFAASKTSGGPTDSQVLKTQLADVPAKVAQATCLRSLVSKPPGDSSTLVVARWQPDSAGIRVFCAIASCRDPTHVEPPVEGWGCSRLPAADRTRSRRLPLPVYCTAL